MTAQRALAVAGTALLLALTAAGTANAAASTALPVLRRAEDINPDPKILEVNFTARKLAVDLTGSGLMANAYTINGSTPGPELHARVGDTIIVHFTNQLPVPTSIHWHGIELDNANDGTTLTQDPVPTGGKFTYRFRVSRPGIFWYHPHGMPTPTNSIFKGLFGPLIVEDPAAAKLAGMGLLPDASQTRTLMFSDTTVCRAPGSNDSITFPAGGQVPWAFSKAYGAFPGHTESPTPRDLCETPRNDDGLPAKSGPLAAGEIPNIQPAVDCTAPCRVNEGQLVLTNGRVPAARAGTPEQPGALASNAQVITAADGQGLRLQLLNGAAERYFRLRLTDQQGKDVPIYRIGGQGGLLDRVRIEGGSLGTVDLKFAPGELVLAPAVRADIVVVARGKPGDVMTLWTEDYQHYGTAAYPFGYGGLPTVPVAHIRIEAAKPGSKAFQIAAGDPLLLHPAVARATPSLKDGPVKDHLLDPATFSPPLPGSKNPLMLFSIVGRESIDGVHAMALEGKMNGMGTGGDYRKIPHVASSRYARVGDTLELTVRNGTQMHHPYHLHGFSFQPVRLEDSLGKTVYQYDYNEFVDTWDIPATHRLVFRVHLEDRGAVDGPDTGGAVGRWMMHCHIFHHNGIGMMTELVVLPREGGGGQPAAGVTSGF